MIGIIGPEDSVQLALSIAEEEGRASDIAPGGYSRPEEAVAIARELGKICQVLLFTGRIPYTLVRESDSLHAEIAFISHSGADLYRTLTRVLLANGGVLPRASIDTVDAQVIREIYQDIDEDPPSHILPIADPDGRLLFSDTDEIVRFHREHYDAGEVALCLTCIGVVYRELQDAGIPVRRVEHTRATVREALQRAWVSAAVHELRSTQLAVVLVRLEETPSRSSDLYSREQTRLEAHQALLKLAKAMRGRLNPMDDSTFLITTSRGVIENAINRHRAGYVSHLVPRDLNFEFKFGFGIGETVVLAEENARRALQISEQTGGTQVVFPDGEVYSTQSEAPPSLHLRETTPGVLNLSAQLGIGPLATRRLVEALNRIDPETVTARQLATAYGVETRSGRRLLRALTTVGYAYETGVQMTTGAGRPQRVYRIDLQGLAAAFGETGHRGAGNDPQSS